MSKDMPASELARWVPVRNAEGRVVEVTAKPEERAALAARFGIVSIEELTAAIALRRDGEVVDAEGRLIARIVQSCAVSGEDLDVDVDEHLHYLFVPAVDEMPDEIELEADELDEIPYEGEQFDLGEAVAQSLALAIDPFLTGPEAEQVRDEVGLSEPEKESPFSVLRDLKPRE